MNQRLSLVARILAVGLLVGAATAACSRAGEHRDGVQDNGPASTFTDSSTSPVGPAQATPTVESSTAASPASAATPDQLDSEINSLNQLINGVNDAISGADGGTSSGE
jgi:hypothetical protein